MRALTPDGIDVAIWDLGGSVPPLLFAHATGMHGRTFEPLASELDTSFHSWSLDLRGHGDTPAPPDLNFDWTWFAVDVLAAVDALGLEKPFGFGHSCGGAALLMAEADRPGTFAAIFCYEPVVPPPNHLMAGTGENPMAAAARRRREVFSSRDEAFDNYASKPPLSALSKQALRAYVDYGFEDLDDGTVRLKCRRENEALTFEHTRHSPAWDRLGEVTCPVALVCGDQPDSFPVTMMESVGERLPAAAVAVAHGLGHFGPLEDPPTIAAHAARLLLG